MATERRIDEAAELPDGAANLATDVGSEGSPAPTRLIDPAATQPLPPDQQAPPDVLGPGQRFGNYQIESKIGEGAMGTVFRLRHQFFERDAALKVLRPHLCSDSTLVRRFLNEARAANAIRHANIIEVVDTGLMPAGGAPYLLMELLEGENLRGRMRRLGRMPVESALFIAAQTASALAAAHDRGIVHRDLKPENLFLVTRGDRDDVVKVLDFGIAKLGADLSGKDIPTQPGAVVGTPRYMSPEQCRGTGTVDHRSDVYALGVILYEMLAGVPPFEAEGIGELLEMHLLREPLPLRTHVPDVPPRIEAAILRAIRKRPDQRFSSMRDLGLALTGLATSAGAGAVSSLASDLMPISSAGRPVPRAAEGAADDPAKDSAAESLSPLPSLLATAAPARNRTRSLAAGFGLVAGIAVALSFAFGRQGKNDEGAPARSGAPAALAPASRASASSLSATTATESTTAAPPATQGAPAAGAASTPPAPPEPRRRRRAPRPRYVPPLW
jgi:serine/threonine protein kinase